MCGISGIVGQNLESNSIHQMVGALKRRGPDDSGVWISEDRNVALGQTRLSIIDLSPTGHQPMFSHNRRFAIVYNGEIYNYKDIRKNLKKKGAHFSTESDTEVVLWAWELMGAASLSALRGMFAFAIWDQLEGKLVLARDRMGIKPLLWTQQNNNILFGSTISSLLASGMVDPVLNEQSFFDYLATGSVFQPKTMIKGIQVLMPGTFLEYKNGIVSDKSYWTLKRDDILRERLEKLPLREQILQTRLMLEETCKYHLVSDVPVGSFLSGGVDSTVITALMTQNSNYRIKSFSVGFEQGFDYTSELSTARQAAEFIGTEHTEIVLTGNDISQNFEDFISVIDQPSIDGLNTYWVSRIAQHDVKVALSGLGGDELFAGYTHFGWSQIFNKPPGIVDKLFDIAYRTYPLGLLKKRHLNTLSSIERFELLRRQLPDSLIAQGLSTNLAAMYFAGHVGSYIKDIKCITDSSVYDISIYECKNYLLNTLLRDADALSMGNSLEVRPIFLDHKLVEFALALPDFSKWRNGVGKYILKEATKDLLPQDFFLRKKSGFTLPISRWITNELKDRLLNAVNSADAELFFNRAFLNKIVADVNKKRNGWHSYLVLVFLEWAAKKKIQI